MKCPNCGGENCQFITSTNTNTNLFSAGDACCGTVLLGPIGMLCGLCGAGSETETKEYWVCNTCGSKFTAEEVREHLKQVEEERKTYTNFTFLFEESTEQVLKLEAYQKFEKYYNDVIKGSPIELMVLVQKPIIANEVYERLKRENVTIFGQEAKILFAICDREGCCATQQTLVWKGYAMPFQLVKEINCYGNSIYINQNCMNFSTPEIAGLVFELFCNLLPDKRGTVYREYEELLQRVQTLEKGKNDIATHFSSQQVYADYVKKTYTECMEYMKRTNPADYTKYKETDNKRNKILEVGVTASMICGVIAGIIGWIDSGFGGFVKGAFFFGICPIAILFICCISKQWNSYQEELLPHEIYVALKEDEKSNLDKEGVIVPDIYKKYKTMEQIADKENGDIDSSKE